jgi:Ca2+-binding RTX toxin-like protein
MATVVVSDPNFISAATGPADVVRADSSVIQLRYSQTGFTETFNGSFGYASDGSVNSGVLNSIDFSSGGHEAIQITGLNIAAATAYRAVINGDVQGLANMLYGGADTVTGSASGEMLQPMSGADTVSAMDGNDSVAGGDGNDLLNGNQGNDLVNGNQGDDQVYGGKGADTLYGGQGADTLHGDIGDDVLSGDRGNDLLYGGAGADHFVFAHGGGVDRVMDFNAAEGDRIQLASGTAYTVVDAQGSAAIDLGGGDQIQLSGVSTASFNSSWVVFV